MQSTGGESHQTRDAVPSRAAWWAVNLWAAAVFLTYVAVVLLQSSAVQRILARLGR
jgi:hypothetical protein